MTDMQRYYKNLAALKPAGARAPAANEPRASVRRSTGFAGRPVTNAVSGNADRLGIARVGSSKAARPATPSADDRFLNFANVQPGTHTDHTPSPSVPIASTRGDTPSFATAADAASFVLQAGKARSGGSVTAKVVNVDQPRPAPPAKLDMNTPEGVAAFILAAGKGKR